MSRSLRTVLVLLLAATLATTAVLADPLRGAQPQRSSAASISSPLDLAARIWRLLAGVWGKKGSQADPSGVMTKNGSMVEPNGSSLQSPVPGGTNGDNGHQVDPDGSL